MIDNSLIDWSRAQFALTAIYHWLFVPLTLGLGLIMSVMETIYYRTRNEFWKKTAKFWMNLFGINFAIGVATGIILEFEFGTNWSNYSWFVGDIFGAPLAIEGILAFFMESTFIAIMFFGWNKVGRGAHLASTWLTVVGATISAWWILVANSWMQHPVGMEFNPDTVRNEMIDFFTVAFSPFAVNKFFHTVASAWVLGSVFVVGVSAWFLLKKRHTEFALSSMKVGAITGLVASILVAISGDGSAYEVAKHQPMKLAAMEGLYNGSKGAPFVGIGVLKCDLDNVRTNEDAFAVKIEVPKVLSFLATRSFDGFVPGINDLLEGGYETHSGIALPATEKMSRGKTAIKALSDYRSAKQSGGDAGQSLSTLKDNFEYFGYGYIDNPKDLVPPIHVTFYSFRVMIVLGGFFLLLFAVICYMGWKKKIEEMRWLQWVALWSIPLAYIASEAGWLVAEFGRQPWAIQDILPLSASVSDLPASSVQFTFFLFLVIFTVLLIAEIGIMLKTIRKGPQTDNDN